MAQNNLVVKIDRTIQHRRKLILGDIVSAWINKSKVLY
jgi:hypothetical protein